jgi:uncharacterized membrane protein YdjX (TVP38/TMEM64 family)
VAGWHFLTDEALVQSYVEKAGSWGPLVLILLNVLQIVIAIIPGHVVQLAAGYLYGPYWGFLYAAIGLLGGAMAAMALARFFGRPVAKWMIGEARLQRWEKVTHSDSTLIWALLMLGPIGDIPFVLAGLSSVSFTKIFLLTLFVRVPSAFLSTAVGGGLIPYYWMVILLAAATVVTLAAMRYKTEIEHWLDNAIDWRISRAQGGELAPEKTYEEPSVISPPTQPQVERNGK